jgi:hypothetical protein
MAFEPFVAGLTAIVALAAAPVAAQGRNTEVHAQIREPDPEPCCALRI